MRKGPFPEDDPAFLKAAIEAAAERSADEAMTRIERRSSY